MMQQEFTIELDSIGEKTGKRYTGTFVCKPFLTMREETDTHRLYNQYAAGLSPDSSLHDDLIKYAYLKYYVINSPGWWDDMIGLSLLDQQPLEDLYIEWAKQRILTRINNNPAVADEYQPEVLKDIGYELPNKADTDANKKDTKKPGKPPKE